MTMLTWPNHALTSNGGITLLFQSARLVAAVAELGSLGHLPAEEP